jgi:uncharacterized membrane protein YdbT with pleckstrin-like domain
MTADLEWFTPDPAETVVWTTKPRLRRILPTVAGAAVWGVVAEVVAFAVVTYGPQFLGEPLPVPDLAVWGIALLFVLTQVVRVVVAYLRVEATDYVLTDRSVYKKTGVFSENVTRVGVDRIQNTTLRKDFLGNVFDYGTVLLSTAGSGGAELAITDLDDPDAFRAELRPLVDASGGPGDDGSSDPDGAGAIDAETAEALVTEARRMRETAERLDEQFDT